MSSTLWRIFNHAVNRKRLFERFADAVQGGVVFLQGGKQQHRYDIDTDIPFKQESNFFYVTGVQDPECSCALNLTTKEFYLFVPKLGDDYALWCGDFPSNEEYKQLTGADKVLYTDDVSDVLVQQWQTKQLYTLKTLPSDITHIAKQIEGLDNKRLYTELTYIRLRKLPHEIEIMRKANKISGDAHVSVMKHAKAGINECQLDSVFTAHVSQHGCKHLAYPSIVAGDNRGATLHYVSNDKLVKDGSLLLIDAGAEYDNYCADITRTYPVNGKFSPAQRQIYEIVLKAQKTVIASMKIGVSWVDMHRLAERIIAQGLLDAGLLKGSLEDVLKNHVQAVFFPHGLGHSLGLDVHDPPNRDGSFTVINEPGIRFLRVHAILEEGMVLTVEPGIYFNERMIKAAFNNPAQVPFLNKDVIDKFMDFGGIRIEDNVVVTKTGVDNLTAGVPKEIDEIENLMKQ